MEKLKATIPVLAFAALAITAIAGDLWSFLIFPAIAFLLWFLSAEGEYKPEMRTAISGICLYLVFLVWHYIQYEKMPLLFILTFTLAVMASFEAWRFTAHVRSNVWGLMNLVVFWTAMEHLMLLWLPFNISPWLIGQPLVNSEISNEWLPYIGKHGYSLWALTGGLFLYKSFKKKRLHLLMLAISLLLIIIPAVIEPDITTDSIYVAQGEWVGRTALWVSVLIMLYTFVKRIITKK